MSGNTTRLTELDVVTGTSTSTASAATLTTQIGVITTESLSTAAGGTYLMNLVNPLINASSNVFTVVGNGTATVGGLVPIRTTPAAGSVAILYQNVALNALNGTVKIFVRVDNLT